MFINAGVCPARLLKDETVEKMSARILPQDLDPLSTCSLFLDVDLPALMPLLEACDERQLGEGEILLSPEVRNDRLFIILSGQLSVHLQQSCEHPLAYFGPGECVGELSVFDRHYPSAWVTASKDSRLLAISDEQLNWMVDNFHSVARNLLNILVTRVRSGNAAMSDLETHANLDALTGLNNRRWLDKTFSRVLHRANREGGHLCLGMIDVDSFKRYNDDYGHQVGDLALKQVARKMQSLVRPFDLLARYGGEEFSLLLPDAQASGAEKLFERIRLGIERMGPVMDGDTSYPPVTISVGVAERRPSETLESLISRADAALYRAKAEGRNRICFAGDEN